MFSPLVGQGSDFHESLDVSAYKKWSGRLAVRNSKLAAFYNARLSGGARIDDTMKGIITLIAAVSLGLTGALIAQPPPQGEESPSKKGGRGEKTTQQGANENQPKANAGETRGKGRASAEGNANANQPSTTTNEAGAGQRGGGKHGRGAKSENANATGAETSPAAGANANEPTTAGGGKGKHGRNATKNTASETGAEASPGASAPMETGKKGKQGRGANAEASAAPSAAGGMSPATGTNAATGNTAATNTATTNAAGAGNLKGQGNVGRGGKRVEKQQVQQIKQQHANFKAQPKPNVAPAVTYNQNYRINNAESWQGPQYEVFRSYHPEWHDQGWYHSHYGQVLLIAGGWYFFNRGYWYPAWGYDQNAAYYAYDGPIYAGRTAEPPDKVIADVQAELQEMGYYTGEVDGLLGPLTRQAVRDYQADHGLMVTEVIDEPTLDALEIS